MSIIFWPLVDRSLLASDGPVTPLRKPLRNTYDRKPISNGWLLAGYWLVTSPVRSGSARNDRYIGEPLHRGAF
jgi:hypothetical protein